MIKQISIRNFKNLNVDLSFTGSINVVCADNGKGKTNLLEAIFICLNGFSFKSSKDSDSIDWNYLSDVSYPKFYKISITLDSSKKEVVFQPQKLNRKVFILNSRSTTISKYLNNDLSVVFSPTSIDLVTGSPALRREEIDIFIIQNEKEFIKILQDYKTLIRNKNKLLERKDTIRANLNYLEILNEKIASLGSSIIAMRILYLNELSKLSSELSEKLFHFAKNKFEISYITKSYLLDHSDRSEIEKVLKKVLADNLEKEIIVQSSIYGPHRDDINIKLNGINLRSFGSRGQQRMASFIIKASEFTLLKEKGYNVVVLIDDLPSELDALHVDKVQRYLLSLNTQVIITAVAKKEFENDFLKACNVITF